MLIKRVGQGSLQGFTLLEFIMVVVVIGVLAASSLIYYEKTLAAARRVGVEVFANRFTAAVALIRAQWLIESSLQIQQKPSSTWRVNVDNTAIFLNEYGWPANTDGRSAKSNDQTVDECYQVWKGVLQNPPQATLEGRGNLSDSNDINNEGKQRYHIILKNNSLCRYELVTQPRGTHAFEYDLRNGNVLTMVPPLD